MSQPKYVGAARFAPKVDANLEPWTVLGHLAARNRLGRMRLGIGVTDTARRNPAVTAQAAATLHLLTKGRAILGIGTGEREGNEPYGVDWSRPVARFEEAMATIRALWDSGGELVSRDSEFFPLHNAVFDLWPYRGKWPEIWIASHGPRMLRATGRYADTWFPAAVFSAGRLCARFSSRAVRGIGCRPRSVVDRRGDPVLRRHRAEPPGDRRGAPIDGDEDIRLERPRGTVEAPRRDLTRSAKISPGRRTSSRKCSTKSRC